MATFDFQAPDGTIHSVEAPDGATPDQAFQFLQQQIGQPQQSGVVSAVKNAPADMLNTAASMAGTAADAFNPASAANAAYMDRMKNASFMGGIGQEAQHVLDVGKSALAAAGLIPATLGTPIVNVGGAVYDAASPKFTADQQKQLAASGVTLPSGRDAVSTALLGVRPANAGPAGLLTKAADLPTVDQLKQAYTSVVNDPAVKSISIPPADVGNLSASVQSDLIAKGFRPTAKSAPDTFAELQRLTPGSDVSSVNIDDLLASRRALGATSIERDQFGKATPDSVAAKQAMMALDQLIESRIPQMADAIANYSAAMGADRLNAATVKAERRAGKTGSGMNIENTLRQEADKVPTRGLTPDQKAQLDKIVLGTLPRDALRIAGKLGVDGGLSLAMHSGMAIGTHGGTIPITAAGTLARKVGEMLTQRAMGNLGNSIRANSPLARSLAPVPVSPPNPLLGGIALGRVPQIPPLLLRQLLGVVPSPADQQQQ